MSTSEPAGRGRPRTFDSGRVVAVAMDAYWNEGPDAPSLNEICRRAEVSKPGLYRAFGGEDQLMDVVLEHYAETVLAANIAAFSVEPSLRATLDVMVATFTNPDRPGPPGCLLARLQQSDRLGPAVAARVEALRDQARAAYAAMIDAAKARGEIGEEVPTDVAAAMIDIGCNSILTRMAAGEDPQLLRAQAMLAFSSLA